MNLFGGWGAAVSGGDVRVGQHRFKERPQVRMRKPGDYATQFCPHLLGVALRGRKIVGEFDLAIVHAPHLVNCELRAIVEDLDQAFDLDEIVAVEGVQGVADVVPHLGVKLSGAVGQ